MSSAVRLALVLAAATSLGAVTGCSGAADPGASSADGAGSAGGGSSTETAATSADSEVVSVSADPSAIASAESLAVIFTGSDASGMLTLTAGDATDGMRGSAQASLAATCGEASFVHAPGSSSLKASFASGCTLPRLGAVSGSIDLETTSDVGARSLSMGFTFDELVLDGATYNGTYDLTVSGRGTYGVESALTVTTASGTRTIAYSGTALVADGGATLDGSVGGSEAIRGVHHTFGACYADAGSIEFTDGGKAETLTFEATTPATGTAELTLAGLTTSVALPSYGACGAAAVPR